MIYANSDDLYPGARALVKSARATLGDDPILVRVEPHPLADHLKVLVTQNGVRYESADLGYRAKNDPSNHVFLAWTAPLPQLSDGELIEYYKRVSPVDVLIRRESRQLNTSLFFVDSIGEERATGKLVYAHSDRYEDGDEQVHGNFVASSYTVNLPIDELPEGTTQGALILSADIHCTHLPNEGIDLTHLKGPALIKNDIELPDVARYFPSHRGGEPAIRSRLPRFYTANTSDHRRELDMAKARTEEDIGLFVSIGEGTDRSLVSVAEKGIYLFCNDDVATYFENKKPGPGLWVLKDIDFNSGWHSTHYGMEHDESMSGDFVPATPGDLAKFDLTLASAGQLINESIFDSLATEPYEVADIPVVDTVALALEYMQKAQATVLLESVQAKTPV